MPSLTYVFFAFDEAGNPLPDLNPTWVGLKRLAGGSDVMPPPVISEHGFGHYKFDYDPETNGDASGQVDLNVASLSPAYRLINLVFYASDSRTTYNLDQAVGSRATPASLRLTLDYKSMAALLLARMQGGGGGA